MDIQTATTTIVTIQLTAEEANGALLDPTPLQAALARALHPDVYADGRQNGKKKARANARPKATRTGRGGRRAAQRECPWCHEMKSPQGYGRHVAACEIKQHRNAPAAGD